MPVNSYRNPEQRDSEQTPRHPLPSSTRGSRRVASRPVGARPPSRQSSRVQQVRTATASSSSRGRGQAARRVARYVLEYAFTRYLEQQHHRRPAPSQSQQRSTQNHAHGDSAIGHAVTSVLLEQLIQEIIEYIVRHNFFRGSRDHNTSTPGQGERDQPPAESQSSQSSTDQRRRRRHRRRSEAMVTSLDRLSSELEATYDAVVRVLRPSDGGPPVDENLRSNADELRRAITRCMARVESVRRRHHHYGSRRTSRRGGAGGSARISRTQTGDTGQG